MQAALSAGVVDGQHVGAGTRDDDGESSSTHWMTTSGPSRLIR
jgi:hypothetical protein